ncbi:glycosyltransferase family 4 protein [Candidatus Woesearchaeota archaeon]|nr:glycosyltransferase family 4 protein [Candidatus Woesearchaeota archaeon]
MKKPSAINAAIVIPTQPSINSSLQNLLKVYEYLIKKYGVRATIFTDRKNELSYANFRIEKIRSLDYKTPIEKILFVIGLPRFCYFDLVEKLNGYDVIESSNPEFYWFAYQSYLAAKKYNSRLIYRTSQTVEGFFLFRITKPIALHFARKACRFARHFLFANPEAEERYIRLGLLDKGAKKSIVIGHPTDTKCFRPLKTEKRSKPVILSVGGLYKLKGHHLIIKAAKILIDNGDDVELWIVGEGYYKNSIERLANRLGISSNVKFLGAKKHDELAMIYNQSSVFVLANFQEITPAVNEALACGVPVVAMECGGLDFVVKDGVTGLVARRFDVEDLAGCIKRMLGKREEAKRMAANGRRLILKKFSIEKVAEKFYKSFTD